MKPSSKGDGFFCGLVAEKQVKTNRGVKLITYAETLGFTDFIRVYHPNKSGQNNFDHQKQIMFVWNTL